MYWFTRGIGHRGRRFFLTGPSDDRVVYRNFRNISIHLLIVTTGTRISRLYFSMRKIRKFSSCFDKFYFFLYSLKIICERKRLPIAAFMNSFHIHRGWEDLGFIRRNTASGVIIQFSVIQLVTAYHSGPPGSHRFRQRVPLRCGPNGLADRKREGYLWIWF
jgi:hypothetical protein